MKKQILSLGFDIPGNSENNVDFYSQRSLMDADILIISPRAIFPYGELIRFNSGGGCYNMETTKLFQASMNHLSKELEDFLNSGKNVFLFLNKEEDYELASNVTSPRKNLSSYSTYTLTNYSFLPLSIGALTSATGKKIKFSGNSIFANLFNDFKEYFEYEAYIENPKGAEVIFTGNDKTKILGASYQIGAGNLVILPTLEYDEESFTDVEQDCWNTEGVAFGNKLVNCLITIDQNLNHKSEQTPMPEWILDDLYLSNKEVYLKEQITKSCKEIEEIKEKNEELRRKLDEEVKLKELLFETGKPLEQAVTKALKILGYKAENYDDGDLEMDQVIVSPEKIRYIGECEGKDNKDINVDKFRQLQDALSADYERDEVEEKAFGILFGNAERLKSPSARKLDFTKKCKSGAEREKIALVKTADLFLVAKHANENLDESFKKACRDAIHNGLGQIVVFPAISIKMKGSQKDKSNTSKK